LLDASVDDAGHFAHLVEDAVGNAVVGLDVGSIDLYVDRRPEPEIQNLGDHVGGRE
jgi:hypothetical protein